MADLDKAIKGIECCLNPNMNCYHDDIGCPYESQCWLSDSLPTRPLREDCYELLKEYKEHEELLKMLGYHWTGKGETLALCSKGHKCL